MNSNKSNHDAAAPANVSGQSGQHGTPARKHYQKPQLTVFGKVAELTNAGSSGAGEGSKGTTDPTKMSSDFRLKENIVRIGHHPLGFGLYLFNYRSGHAAASTTHRHFGVMAQEVEKVMPAAVSVDSSGYKVVDYAMLGISPVVH